MKNLIKLMIVFALTVGLVPLTTFADYTNQGSFYTTGDYNSSGYGVGGNNYSSGPVSYNYDNYSTRSYGYQTASAAGAYPYLPSTGGGGKALANKIKNSSTKTTLALITVSIVSIVGFLFFRKSPEDRFDMKA